MTKSKRTLNHADAARQPSRVSQLPASCDKSRCGNATAILALLGAACYWLSLPPCHWSWLGWVALAPWSVLIALRDLPGRRPWRTLWIVGTAFWMAMLYFIPLPHWSLWIGWVLLGGYLSLYIVGFIAAGRWLVHQFHWPLWVAIPVAWTGFELIRCHVFGGLGLALLGHTQYRNSWLLQLADMGGAYSVSFMLAFVSACAAQAIVSRHGWARLSPLAAAMVVTLLLFYLGYGKWTAKSTQDDGTNRGDALQAVIVQGSIDVVFASAEQRAELEQSHYLQYRRLAHEARRQFPHARLLIWPESTFLPVDLIPDERESQLDAMLRERLELLRDHFFAYWADVMGLTADGPNEPPPFRTAIDLLTGAGSMNPVTDEIYNSVLHIDQQGQVRQRYLKNHCVPFGEYVPLSQWFPFLDRLHPYGRSLTFGSGPAAIEVDGIVLAPSICFESTVPHLIRRQLRQLSQQGRDPDYLVNITNDGWFFGTNCLDLHLACTVFRAVETGKPVLVSANTGFSAEIDRRGKVLQQGPRRNTALLPVTLYSNRESISTLYAKIGDWPWVLCAGIALGAALLTLSDRRSRHPSDGPARSAPTA